MTHAARPLAASIALALGAIPLSFAATAPALAATAQNDMASVTRAIRAITTLKARFEQRDAGGGIQTGTLLIKQPGHIRFEFAGGDLLIVGTGRSLNMIDYEVNQVERLPIGSTPLGALLDPKRDLSRYGKIVSSGNPRLVAVSVRDPEHAEYGTMTLVFERKPAAPGGLELTGWQMQDSQGNRTLIRLSDIAYGMAIPDSAFAWRDPRPKGPRR